MDPWTDIRHRVLKLGVSKRAILRETGMHHSTLERILAHHVPPGYRQATPRAAPKLGEHIPWIKDLLISDRAVHKKQRRAARRIFHRLRDERGYSGGETVAKDLVRELARTTAEAFMPLAQPPGEAQVDFFEARVRYPASACPSKVHAFAMHLPFSDLFFLKAYARECAEVFRDGHAAAFDFFGGVPARVSYDNLKIAAQKILGAHARRLAPRFLELKSRYLSEAHCCHVRRGNEKGCVENLAQCARANFMVPVPRVKDLADLNVRLADARRRDGARVLRGKAGKAKLELLPEEGLSPLPAAPFEACRKEALRASSRSWVRFDHNEYSVPVRHAHHALAAKGVVEYVSIHARSGEEVARHVRCREKEKRFLEPLHDRPPLERKPGALDHAAPFAGLVLPACFDDLRRRLEADGFGHRGAKDSIGVRRRLEKRPLFRGARAVEKALAACARPGAELAGSYLYGDERPAARVFRLGGRPHLAGVRVAPPDLSGYGALAAREGRAWARRKRPCCRNTL